MSENNGYVLGHTGEELDAAIEYFLNPRGGLSEQVQVDYEQNDSTQVDYIKNRPFYHIDNASETYTTSETTLLEFVKETHKFSLKKIFDLAPLTSQMIGNKLNIELVNFGINFEIPITIKDLIVCRKEFDIFELQIDLSAIGHGTASTVAIVARAVGNFNFYVKKWDSIYSINIIEKGTYTGLSLLEDQGIQVKSEFSSQLTTKIDQKFQHFVFADVDYISDEEGLIIDEYNLNLLREHFKDSYIFLRVNQIFITGESSSFIIHYGLPVAGMFGPEGDLCTFNTDLLGTITIDLNSGLVEKSASL